MENQKPQGVSQIRNGIHQDNSLVEHPKDKLRFALNAVPESDSGDQTFVSNEESNETCFDLPTDYIPLGKVYIGDNETVIFSVKSDNTISEIGIADVDCNYTTIVNSADLGFTIENPIDATFRLRRGCERIIYWVDPKIRTFNIDRPENYKTLGLTEVQVNDPYNHWDINDFFLFKRYESIPQFDLFEVEENGGLLSGSYNFAIQYLDNDFNPTEFMTVSEIIPIYVAKLDSRHSSIRGSSTLKTAAKDFPATGKSIKMTISNLDQNFVYYRIAIIEANNADGLVSAVKYSAPLSTTNNVYSYSGSNAETEGTIEEVQQYRTSLYEAKHIEQIENRLTLSNVKGSPVPFCELQKYASKIKANLVTKSASLTEIKDNRNTSPYSSAKSPYIKVDNQVGYMPGEIYAFGIQYIFEDNSVSPVYHIPGKNSLYVSDMSSDNELDNFVYIDNNACSKDYWGVDSQGVALKNQPIRHHRFPLRSEMSNTINRFNNSLYGIQFSEIEKPSLIDTNNIQVVGYQIVRQERNIDNKTIIDSAILYPVIEDNGYEATSFLTINKNDLNRISTTRFGYISMEAKFGGDKRTPDQVIKEGYCGYGALTAFEKSSFITPDVAPGTSWNPDVHRRRDKDTDGFDLKVISRIIAVNTSVQSVIDYTATATVTRVFELDSLESDGNLYNTQADNKANIIEFSQAPVVDAATTKAEFCVDTGGFGSEGRNPYVIFKKNISDPYSNFMVDAYYAETPIKLFPTNLESVDVFNGDSYINTINYTVSSFYDIDLAIRSKKRGLWRAILGVLSIIGGAILIATGVGAVAGVAVIGFGLSQVATGIKQENIARVYQEEYEAGLRVAVTDDDITPAFDLFTSPRTQKNPYGADDEIQWFSDTLNNAYLESSINIGLREGLTKSGLRDFMNSPDIVSNFEADITDYAKADPTLYQEIYMQERLTVTDSETEAGKLYKGFIDAEIYDLNPDYQRINNAKIYFHLPLEYDCCSDCTEEFPNRIHYSQQAFQEERSDNYQSFLPNDYRDIEAENGVITDVFKIQNNLYIHTEEALFHLPQNIQERVTGDIVSFIGTGDFFNIPPRKIVDSQNSSAGSVHKWSRIKTPFGVFFLSYFDRKWYKFDGQKLDAISNTGLSSWFRNNIPFTYYNNVSGNINNPTNPVGLGFSTVYDSRKERVLLTKIDRVSGQDDKSWTVSYSLKNDSIVSWHSYTPEMYIGISNDFFSIKNAGVWRHNALGSFQTFYGVLYPHIIEYVSVDNQIMNKIWNSIALHTEAQLYSAIDEDFTSYRYRTFNKAVLYNGRQSSGELNLIIKDITGAKSDYLGDQVKNTLLDTPISNNEGIWSFNNFKDLVSSEGVTLFLPRQNDDFIDKVVNPAAIDLNKSWTQLESFRGKYLVVRLIFDTFANTKLITNYSVEDETISTK